MKDNKEEKNARQVFKETVKKLGFSNALPSQMTNSDYWMCTCEAMQEYADQEAEKARKDGFFAARRGHFSPSVNASLFIYDYRAIEDYLNSREDGKENG